MRGLSERRRARREREAPTGELQLAAMVDMMINLLLFLLNLYGTSTGAVQPGKELVFAPSTEVAPVRFAPTVVVSRADVRVGDEVVGSWSAEDRAPGEAELSALKSAMLLLPRAAGPGELLVQADRRVSWSALSPVLSTAQELGFTDIRFAVSSTADPLRR